MPGQGAGSWCEKAEGGVERVAWWVGCKRLGLVCPCPPPASLGYSGCGSHHVQPLGHCPGRFLPGKPCPSLPPHPSTGEPQLGPAP